MKQFDRTRLGTKVAGISSYSIFFFFFGNDLAPVVVIITITGRQPVQCMEQLNNTMKINILKD